MALWRNGRRSGLKIRRPQGCPGSSPGRATKVECRFGLSPVRYCFDSSFGNLSKGGEMKLTFDSACECLRSVLPETETNALISAAVELKEDTRSASELAIEFGVPSTLVEG